MIWYARPEGLHYIYFGFRGHAIGKVFDFPDTGIRNDIDFHNFGVRSGTDFQDFGVRNGPGVGGTIHILGTGTCHREGYRFSRFWCKERYRFSQFSQLV